MPAPYTVTSTEVTGAAAAAATVTLAAAAGVRQAVEAVTVSVSGAASGPITLTVTDGATVVWSTDLSLTIGVPVSPLPYPLMGTAGNALTVATSAGAASSVVKLDVEHFDLVPAGYPTA